MKTIKDATHFRNENMRHLCEGLLSALAHERTQLPPVEIPYDLNTAAMLCMMGRRQLLAYLREHPGEYVFKQNKFTKQCFLYGEDIKRIREAIVEQKDTGYSDRALRLPCVQKRLADAGFGKSGGE